MQHMPAIDSIGQVTVFHALLFHIHILFIGGIVVGGVLFAVWAARTLPPRTLRNVSLWMLGVFTVLMLATVPFCLGLAMFLQ
jgi:hypothetical protein